jgi:hypothetical protein
MFCIPQLDISECECSPLGLTANNNLSLLSCLGSALVKMMIWGHSAGGIASQDHLLCRWHLWGLRACCIKYDARVHVCYGAGRCIFYEGEREMIIGMREGPRLASRLIFLSARVCEKCVFVVWGIKVARVLLAVILPANKSRAHLPGDHCHLLMPPQTEYTQIYLRKVANRSDRTNAPAPVNEFYLCATFYAIKQKKSWFATRSLNFKS